MCRNRFRKTPDPILKRKIAPIRNLSKIDGGKLLAHRSPCLDLEGYNKDSLASLSLAKLLVVLSSGVMFINNNKQAS